MSVAVAARPDGKRQPPREPMIQSWLVLGALGVLVLSVGVGFVLGPTAPGRPVQLGEGGPSQPATAGAPAASPPASTTGSATPLDPAVPPDPNVPTHRAEPRDPVTTRPRTTFSPAVPPPSVRPTASQSTPTQTPQPTPTPAPPSAAVYEAEAAGNILTGSAVVAPHPHDPGGAIVTGIGRWSDDPGTLTFTGVTAPASGMYLVTIHYVHAEATGGRSAQVSVAWEHPVYVTTTDPGGTVVVQLPLAYGLNTITIENWDSRAPDIDRIEVAPLPS